jgi:hypothetical protein
MAFAWLGAPYLEALLVKAERQTLTQLTPLLQGTMHAHKSLPQSRLSYRMLRPT